MKKSLISCLYIFLALFMLITVLTGCFEQQSPKVCAIEERENIIVYNNTIYNEISDRYDFSQNMILLSDEKIDLASYYEDSDFYYLLDNEYFIYKGDDPKSPIAIYKENIGFGISGWLYIKDGFDYEFENIETHKIVEIFVEHVDTWSTEDSIVIERIKTAILNREDLVPIISEYTNIEWYRLYIRFKGTPFVQEVGRQKNGEFQYNNQ